MTLGQFRELTKHLPDTAKLTGVDDQGDAISVIFRLGTETEDFRFEEDNAGPDIGIYDGFDS